MVPLCSNAFTVNILQAVSDGDVQSNCSAIPASSSLIIPDDTEKALSCIFASADGPDEDLWARSWSYGSCTGIPQPEYFQLIVGKYEELNPNKLMYTTGVQPPYIDGKAFLAAMKNATGVQAILQCDSIGAAGSSQLTSVQFCLSTIYPYKTIDCPAESKEDPYQCLRSLTLPTLAAPLGEVSVHQNNGENED